MEPGRSATRTITVGDEHTATAVGSGDVPVLATPVVLAVAEGTCVDAVAGAVPDDHTTVGTWAEVEHRAPSGLGAEVAWHAELTAVDGPRLAFEVTVTDGGREVAHVRHRRAVVERSRFSQRPPDGG